MTGLYSFFRIVFTLSRAFFNPPLSKIKTPPFEVRGCILESGGVVLNIIMEIV